jgi:hypothetical protein
MHNPATRRLPSGLTIIILITITAQTWKYFDLRSEIQVVRLEAMASSLSAASAHNFAVALTGSDQALAVNECRNAAGLPKDAASRFSLTACQPMENT